MYSVDQDHTPGILLNQHQMSQYHTGSSNGSFSWHNTRAYPDTNDYQGMMQYLHYDVSDVESILDRHPWQMHVSDRDYSA